MGCMADFFEVLCNSPIDNKNWYCYNLEFGSKNGVTLENTGLRRFLCMALWPLFLAF